MPSEGATRKRKSNRAMVTPIVMAKSTGPSKGPDWNGIGTVAGSTLSGLGAGLSSVSNGASGLSTPVGPVDNTPILVLGGVLLVGVIVFAMRR